MEGLPPLKSEDEDGHMADDAENLPQTAPEAGSRGKVLLTTVEGFRSCLCPRCLRSMPLRRTRPRASVYSGGVRCDYCRIELMGEAEETSVRVNCSFWISQMFCLKYQTNQFIRFNKQFYFQKFFPICFHMFSDFFLIFDCSCICVFL